MPRYLLCYVTLCREIFHLSQDQNHLLFSFLEYIQSDLIMNAATEAEAKTAQKQEQKQKQKQHGGSSSSRTTTNNTTSTNSTGTSTSMAAAWQQHGSSSTAATIYSIICWSA
jgi:hypothetical protein